MGDTMPSNTAVTFDESDRRWLCCFNRIHVKDGLKYVGIVHALLFVIFFFGVLWYTSSVISHMDLTETPSERFLVRAVLLVVAAIIIGAVCAAFVFLYRGVREERRFFIIPYIVMTGFELIFMALYTLITAAVLLISVAHPRRRTTVTDVAWFVLLIAVFPLSVLASHILFISVAWRCYHYLDKRHVADKMGGHTVRYTVPSGPFATGNISFQNPTYADEQTTVEENSEDNVAQQ